MSSDILSLEISHISDYKRKAMVQDILRLASYQLQRTVKTKILATQLMTEGLTALDAAHVAIALENNINYFCTSDDKLLKKLKNLLWYKQCNVYHPLN